jgi:hypothetical protein
MLRQSTSRINQTSELCMIDDRKHIVALTRRPTFSGEK